MDQSMNIRSKWRYLGRHKYSMLHSNFDLHNNKHKCFHSSFDLKDMRIFLSFRYKIDQLDSSQHKHIHYKFVHLGIHIGW